VHLTTVRLPSAFCCTVLLICPSVVVIRVVIPQAGVITCLHLSLRGAVC
jgi:hypothetical protein